VINTGGDTVTLAYERLRHHLRSGSPGGGRFGLAVLLREGLAAWIDRCATVPGAAEFICPDHVAAGPHTVAPQIRNGVVQILATIVLSMRDRSTHA
jgi:hypothetical protein